jgi:hypothetical protein
VASGAHPFTVGRRCDSCHSGRPIPKADSRQGDHGPRPRLTHSRRRGLP